ELLPAGRPHDRAGLGWLPEGGALYDHFVRRHTTFDDVPPEEIHRIGLDELDRLAAEYAGVGGRLFRTTAVDEPFHRRRPDPPPTPVTRRRRSPTTRPSPATTCSSPSPPSSTGCRPSSGSPTATPPSWRAGASTPNGWPRRWASTPTTWSGSACWRPTRGGRA